MRGQRRHGTAAVRTVLPSMFLTLNRSECNFLTAQSPDLRARLEQIAEQRGVIKDAGKAAAFSNTQE
ncbi:MAG TPA: hypothetical protein VHS31_06385 [Tepidisphaeraceae bacterium]|nr:hypothetical protein [Tepidisphaeraceae bacterium]